MMNWILEELAEGLPDARQLASLTIRLVIAMFLGAVIGFQRERLSKPAGLRTHMLVALGAALLVIAPIEFGMDSDGL
jgi:putative Mg2+ transporter-C (MgtC) family protein